MELHGNILAHYLDQASIKAPRDSGFHRDKWLWKIENHGESKIIQFREFVREFGGSIGLQAPPLT